MPTSKLPVEWVMVSAYLFRLKKDMPSCILLNTRPEQRENGQPIRNSYIWQDSYAITEEIIGFLKLLPAKSKIALHFQGYGKETGTAVVQIDEIYWCRDELYPRLDFEHPEGFDELINAHFWGAFILAISHVDQNTECFFQKDPRGEAFGQLKNKFLSLPSFDYPPEYNIYLVTKMNENNIVSSEYLGKQKIEGAKPKVNNWIKISFSYKIMYSGTYNFEIVEMDEAEKNIFILAPNENHSNITQVYCTNNNHEIP